MSFRRVLCLKGETELTHIFHRGFGLQLGRVEGTLWLERTQQEGSLEARAWAVQNKQQDFVLMLPGGTRVLLLPGQQGSCAWSPLGAGCRFHLALGAGPGVGSPEVGRARR